jgi:hypothetical protein
MWVALPATVISAAGTPPSAAAVTVTSAGSGCADVSSHYRGTAAVRGLADIAGFHTVFTALIRIK